jgi:hypothetical protein
MSSQLTGYGNRRRELDFYPTPPDATIALLDFLKMPKGTLIWEPACGDGAMSQIMKSYGYNVISTDIREGYGEVADFLAQDTWYLADAIITNPPFNLSLKFIDKALNQLDIAGRPPLVAMLLKSQYWHASSRLKFFNGNPPAWVLPLTWRPYFMNGERGGRPTMEVAWTVWTSDKNTKYKPLAKPSKQLGFLPPLT